MDRERMKYLFREILGVDFDEVVRKVVATIAVERAKQAQKNTTDWKRYMEAEGGSWVSAARKGPRSRRGRPSPTRSGWSNRTATLSSCATPKRERHASRRSSPSGP